MTTPFAEKYRPVTVDECVIPEVTKQQVKGLIASGNLPTMLFVGSPGCGKTTLAKAIANELNADLLFINASLDNSIDNIRNQVRQFASTMSFTDSKKITVLDESDGLSAAAQGSLRGLIEEFSHNHAIIFTGNFGNKIIDPIKSRCKIIDFKIPSAEKPVIQAKFLKRVMSILDKEGIEYDKEAVAALVIKKFPDFRSVLNELQGYAAGGKIDAGILVNMSEESFKELTTAIKAKKYNDVRKWVAEHKDLDSTHIFRTFYDASSSMLQPKSIPELVMLIGEYMYKDYFCADKEINIMAFLTSVMVSSIEWK